MALTQQAMLRAARLESGLFTTCLDAAVDGEGHPFTPMTPDLAGDGDIEITRAQNRNYALADGFQRMVRQANGWSLFLGYQAQAERHYRRAVEEFDRLKALRAELPNEAILEVQPEEKEPTCVPPDEPISPPQPSAEPDSQPSPEPLPNVGQAILPAAGFQPALRVKGRAKCNSILRPAGDTEQPVPLGHRRPVAPESCRGTKRTFPAPSRAMKLSAPAGVILA
jgi:hypothetical protein